MTVLVREVLVVLERGGEAGVLVRDLRRFQTGGYFLPALSLPWVGRQIAEVKSKLQRMSPVEQGDEYHSLFGDLVALESYRRSLLEQASGDDLSA